LAAEMHRAQAERGDADSGQGREDPVVAEQTRRLGCWRCCHIVLAECRDDAVEQLLNRRDRHL
jgi:hypothetical protein